MARGKGKSEDTMQYIEIDDTYKIRLDARNYTLLMKSNSKSDEDNDDDETPTDGYKILGYHSSVLSALQSLVKVMAREEIKLTKKQTITFQEYYESLLKANNKIINLIEPINKQIDNIKGLRK